MVIESKLKFVNLSSEIFIPKEKIIMAFNSPSGFSLEEPLRWKSDNTDVIAVLNDLQGNILKGHGRNHTQNLFLHFNNSGEAKLFIKTLAPNLKTAYQQLKETDLYKTQHTPGGVFICLFLSYAGYQALGIADDKIPENEPFREGLKARQGKLSDPPVNNWDETFQHEIHAMILIGDANPQKVKDTSAKILNSMPTSVKLLGSEEGLAMHNANGDGIEHFGYVDGRSQPLLLVEDIEAERDMTDGIWVWDPKFPLKQVMVPCPGGSSDQSFGSYFVFRKLEQNVKGFRSRL
jgi:deferrochelatase/peroxidase EfeB